ncbi:hypothetical protein VTL71DRAFT_1388 [Oculimacula yallundae]|uniref:LysM domain-containing protein n=1 Tax=Oculimacula yallundae TaxID=86028 RepID=A0ABR4CCN4_9HELO
MQPTRSCSLTFDFDQVLKSPGATSPSVSNAPPVSPKSTLRDWVHPTRYELLPPIILEASSFSTTIMLYLHPQSPLAIAAFFLIALFPTVSADDCVPWTWSWRSGARVGIVDDAVTSPLRAAVNTYQRAATIEPGDVNCRSWTQTYDEVGYWSCSQLADDYGITLDKFWILNPTLAPDCEAIMPNTEYCVDGFIEPLRSTDGFCGPNHKNATCIGSDFGQCCNAGTWKCGQTDDDCSNGICWEGQCPGHMVYTTNGNCGYQNGNTLCAALQQPYIMIHIKYSKQEPNTNKLITLIVGEDPDKFVLGQTCLPYAKLVPEFDYVGPVLTGISSWGPEYRMR